jgi:hypothetical protein
MRNILFAINSFFINLFRNLGLRIQNSDIKLGILETNTYRVAFDTISPQQRHILRIKLRNINRYQPLELNPYVKRLGSSNKYMLISGGLRVFFIVGLWRILHNTSLCSLLENIAYK